MAIVTGMTSDAITAALGTKVDKTTSVFAGTGLTGGGNLATSPTLNVAYGSAAGTALQGNDATVARVANNLSDLSDKAAARSNLGISQRLVYDVRDYGAKGDGTTDDTTSINSAISAADGAGGCVVYFPSGTYKISGSLTMWVNNLILRGENKGNTTIKPVAGSTFDVIATPIPAVAGTAGYTKQYIGVESLTIDCSLMTSTVNGAGNAIHFFGAIASYIRDVIILSCPNWGIVLDGDATNFSTKVEIRANSIQSCGGGILATFSDECALLYNTVDGAKLNTASTQPAFDSPDNVGYPVRIKSGFGFVEGNIIGSGGTYTSPALQVESSETMRISNNRFNQCRYQAIRCIGDNNIIEGNQIGNASSVGAVEALRLGSKNNIVIGNRFDILAGAAHYTYCIYEPSAKGSNVVVGNQVVVGTSGTIHMDPSSTLNRVANNVGYNPVGPVASQPSVPTTTTPFTNNYGSDATVYVAGGTVTAIAVGGTTTGAIAGAIRVPSGQTIAITYSSVPTWKWFLD